MRFFAKVSLSFVWVLSGFASLFLQPELGEELLARVQISGSLAMVVIYFASSWDILLGLWVLTLYKPCLLCLVQIVTIVLYSVLLTLIAPEYWGHPFGVLSKNVPMIVLIFWLYRLRNNEVRKK